MNIILFRDVCIYLEQYKPLTYTIISEYYICIYTYYYTLKIVQIICFAYYVKYRKQGSCGLN